MNSRRRKRSCWVADRNAASEHETGFRLRNPVSLFVLRVRISVACAAEPAGGRGAEPRRPT